MIYNTTYIEICKHRQFTFLYFCYIMVRIMGYVKGDSDTWQTDLSDDLWDARPEELRATHKGGYQGKGVWQNQFGEEFRQNSVAVVKEWNPTFQDQSPTYTTDMARHAGKEIRITEIHKMKEVYAVDLEGHRLPYVWHLDWLQPKSYMDDELFEI